MHQCIKHIYIIIIRPSSYDNVLLNYWHIWRKLKGSDHHRENVVFTYIYIIYKQGMQLQYDRKAEKQSFPLC